MSSYAGSHISKGYGQKYDSLYSQGTYASRVWSIEQQLLKQNFENKRFHKYVDFACGTGRITSLLETFADVSMGVDVSDTMLEKARLRLSNTELFNLNILDEGFDASAFEDADLVTAFRFFLNSEPELRAKALNKLAELLSDDGVLVFNIHGNKHSLRFVEVGVHNLFRRIYYTVTRKKPNRFSYSEQLSINEIKAFVSQAGLRIDKVYSYAVFPSSVSRMLPQRLWAFVESRLISEKILWGTQLMFFCKKKLKSQTSDAIGDGAGSL